MIRPSFRVTTHSFASAQSRNPENIAVTFTTDMAFSHSTYGMANLHPPRVQNVVDIVIVNGTYTSAQNGMYTSGNVAQMGMRVQYSAKLTRCDANMRVPKKNTMRYIFFANGVFSERHTAEAAILKSCAGPQDQRCCCFRYASYTAGISQSQVTSSKNTNFHPRRYARKLRSMSSTVVRGVHPPASSTHVRRHAPAVPLKLKKTPAACRANCSHRIW